MRDDYVDKLINQLEALGLQEASILQRLVRARARETWARNQGTCIVEETETADFRIGGRVQTTNNVRLLFG
jgi:hypothetical protein